MTFILSAFVSCDIQSEVLAHNLKRWAMWGSCSSVGEGHFLHRPEECRVLLAQGKRMLTTLEYLDPREGVWQSYALKAFAKPGPRFSCWPVTAISKSMYA